MTMSIVRALAVGGAVLFSILEPSFAMSHARHPSSARFEGATNESRGVVTSPSRVPAFDPRGVQPIRLVVGSTSLIRTDRMATPITGSTWRRHEMQGAWQAHRYQLHFL